VNSVFFGLVNLAILLVIFWSARSDRLPDGQASGPFSMRRPNSGPKTRKPVERATGGH
jgi:hypothetical protein